MKLWRNINFRSVSNWTGVENFCIHGLFQEHGWDLSRALNTFFAAKCEEAEEETVSKNVDLPKKTVAEGFSHYLYKCMPFSSSFVFQLCKRVSCPLRPLRAWCS